MKLKFVLLNEVALLMRSRCEQEQELASKDLIERFVPCIYKTLIKK